MAGCTTSTTLPSPSKSPWRPSALRWGNQGCGLLTEIDLEATPGATLDDDVAFRRVAQHPERNSVGSTSATGRTRRLKLDVSNVQQTSGEDLLDGEAGRLAPAGQ